MIDLDDWRREHDAALKAADKFADRAHRNIPPDRWASVEQAKLVARGIDALKQIIAMQTAYIQAMAAELGGDDANAP